MFIASFLINHADRESLLYHYCCSHQGSLYFEHQFDFQKSSGRIKSLKQS